MRQLTAGDGVERTSAPGSVFRLTGVPDGMGAIVDPTNPRKMILVVGHEISHNVGVVRRKGTTGAFVTRLVVDRRTLNVDSADELVLSSANVHLASATSRAAVSRTCSGDLAAPAAYYNSKTALGTRDAMFLNGEEDVDQRAFAWIVTGAFAGHLYELPALGQLRFENNVAHPYEHDETLVLGTDDATTGLVQLYVGAKQSTGSPVERAGLANGRLYYIKAGALTAELSPGSMPATQRFSLLGPIDARNRTYAALRAMATAAGAT